MGSDSGQTTTATPIGRLRYWGGTALLTAVHAVALGVASVSAALKPRYRRVLPFYVDYARETVAGVLRRERIHVRRSGK